MANRFKRLATKGNMFILSFKYYPNYSCAWLLEQL
jgi:hypothetical protein